MANCRRTRFASRGNEANVMQKYVKLMAGFIFTKQTCMIDRTKTNGMAFGNTGLNDACSRQAGRRQVRLEV